MHGRTFSIIATSILVASCGGGGSSADSIPDIDPPSIVSTSPSRQATGVALGQVVSSTWSEGIAPGASCFVSPPIAGVECLVAYSLDAKTLSATNRGAPFAYANTTHYQVRFENLFDRAGNERPYLSVEFDTAAIGTPPAMIASTPVTGATGVDVSQVVTTTWSREIAQSGATCSIVPEVSAMAGGPTPEFVTCTAVVKDDRRTIEITNRGLPFSFGYGTPYRITLGKVRNSDGDAAPDQVISFTTAPPPSWPPARIAPIGEVIRNPQTISPDAQTIGDLAWERDVRNGVVQFFETGLAFPDSGALVFASYLISDGKWCFKPIKRSDGTSGGPGNSQWDYTWGAGCQSEPVSWAYGSAIGYVLRDVTADACFDITYTYRISLGSYGWWIAGPRVACKFN